MLAMSGCTWQSDSPLKTTSSSLQGDFGRAFSKPAFLLGSQVYVSPSLTCTSCLPNTTLQGINGLAALKNAIKQTSPMLQEKLEQDKSLRQSVSKADREARGKAFFSKVYAQHAERILKNMAGTSGGDLSEFAVTCVYGDLMAEDSILSVKDTGLLEFACCYASGAYPQAKGHMYGSRNLGNGRKEIEGVTELCQAVASVLGIEMQREGTEQWAFLEKLKSW